MRFRRTTFRRSISIRTVPKRPGIYRTGARWRFETIESSSRDHSSTAGLHDFVCERVLKKFLRGAYFFRGLRASEIASRVFLGSFANTNS